MDGRGRVAQSLNWIAAIRDDLRAAGSVIAARAREARRVRPRAPNRLDRLADRIMAWRIVRRMPRRAGGYAAAAIILGSLAYGVVHGGHGEAVTQGMADARDGVARALGFRIAAVAISGQKQITREEILATAGVTGRASLLFFDVDAARDRLKANPWIADATILKLYPDRLQISVTEREAFAIWQKNGQLAVIARDGIVLESYVSRRFAKLPMVVGQGAQTRAEEFLTLMQRFPQLRDQVRASILVAERRWNLRLKNGMDVKLPEEAPEKALAHFVALDRDSRLTSRDIVAVDLRLADRVSVRLSEAAAQARAEAAAKDKKAKKKGNDA